jgi:AraC family transcriptional regulator, arabinose operon regulatory protein
MDLLSPTFRSAPLLKDVRVHEYPGSWKWTSRWRSHYNLWIALEGTGVVQWRGRAYSFIPGSCFLFTPEGEVQGGLSADSGMANFAAHLVVKTSRQRSQLEAFSSGYSGRSFAQLGWAGSFCRHLAGLFVLGRQADYALLLQGVSLLMRSLQVEQDSVFRDPTARAILQAAGRIRQRPSRECRVAEMAAEVGLSKSQFHRKFLEVMGVSPNRFVIAERLAQAEKWLRETQWSVQEIADRLGYRDVYFFSRQFKQFRGMSPLHYRRKLPGAI